MALKLQEQKHLIIISDYSPNSFAVFGNATFANKDAIQGEYNGKYNPSLTYGRGYIFSNKNYDSFVEFATKVNKKLGVTSKDDFIFTREEIEEAELPKSEPKNPEPKTTSTVTKKVAPMSPRTALQKLEQKVSKTVPVTGTVPKGVNIATEASSTSFLNRFEDTNEKVYQMAVFTFLIPTVGSALFLGDGTKYKIKEFDPATMTGVLNSTDHFFLAFYEGKLRYCISDDEKLLPLYSTKSVIEE